MICSLYIRIFIRHSSSIPQKMEALEGFAPPTSSLQGKRSASWNYRAMDDSTGIQPVYSCFAGNRVSIPPTVDNWYPTSDLHGETIRFELMRYADSLQLGMVERVGVAPTGPKQRGYSPSSPYYETTSPFWVDLRTLPPLRTPSQGVGILIHHRPNWDTQQELHPYLAP